MGQSLRPSKLSCSATRGGCQVAKQGHCSTSNRRRDGTAGQLTRCQPPKGRALRPVAAVRRAYCEALVHKLWKYCAFDACRLADSPIASRIHGSLASTSVALGGGVGRAAGEGWRAWGSLGEGASAENRDRSSLTGAALASAVRGSSAAGAVRGRLVAGRRGL